MPWNSPFVHYDDFFFTHIVLIKYWLASNQAESIDRVAKLMMVGSRIAE